MDQHDKITDFVDQNTILSTALTKLKGGRELSLQLSDGTPLSLFAKEGQARVEFRPAQNADVQFTFSDSALEKTLNSQAQTVGQFGIEVVKSIAAKEIQVRILTGPFKLLTGGYIDIAMAGGADFLSAIQISNPADIIKLFKKFK